MKKILYLSLIFTNVAFAQSGFIEIEIRDSIRVRPINFEYNVQISDSKFLRYDDQGEVNRDSAKIAMREKYDELEIFLEKRRFYFKSGG